MSENRPGNKRDEIISLLKGKAVTKQDAYDKTFEVFRKMKAETRSLCRFLGDQFINGDKRVQVEFSDISDFHFELKIAGDQLVFMMHTNVFEFDKSHYLHQSKYIKNDPSRSYCGQILVYNFLADSFKYDRLNDLGYLIARVFINKDGHYFAEGKKQLFQQHQNFTESPISSLQIEQLIEDCVIFAINFDLYAPPVSSIPEVSLAEIKESGKYFRLKTGKRLGFKFQFEDDKNVK
jgi:hypothetical protein